MSQKTAIIIGAGPAGLTAAYELLTRTDIKPIVLERSTYMGGISKTVNYKGNRIDIGGHRFFSKIDRIMDWWLAMMPMEATDKASEVITYHNRSRAVAAGQGPDPAATDVVMLLRERKSRIYFLRRFFDYPISLSPDTLGKLGPVRTVKIGMSYLKSLAFPIRPEANLEHFFINRFGKELYLTFFKSYTEKVWGQPCDTISPEWGAQRIKGLSIMKAITHFLGKLVKGPAKGDIKQKGVETSLIEQFLYPKFGPGQMWEEVAKKVVALGGEIRTLTDAAEVHLQGGRAVGVTVRHAETGETERLAADYVFSTMPVRELVAALDQRPPEAVAAIAEGLQYRDFLTVGLLLNKLKIKEGGEKLIKDNWIYIQERDVLVGRLQIFNNWSPYMVADPDKVWVGMEYFLNETDDLWNKPDEELKALGTAELAKIDIIEAADVLDGVVIRQPKAYPGYFGTYARFDELRAHLDGIENLFLVGRNGMHRYNNQDHSMLTAMTAVDNILAGRVDKANLWEINTEEEYHEVQKSVPEKREAVASTTA